MYVPPPPAANPTKGNHPKLEIVDLPIDQLILADRNPRQHPARQIKQLERNINAFGFVSVVIIDAFHNVVCGNARVMAARNLGMETVPTVMISHLTPDQLKAYQLADNKLAEGGKWNQKLLGEIFIELSDIDLDVDLEVATGFSFAEIDLTIEAFKSDEMKADKADELPEPGPEVVQPGDVWLLGKQRLMCASALDPLNWAALMRGKKSKLVLTDPPYNVKIKGHVSGLGKIKHREFVMASGEMTELEYIDFLTTGMTLARDNSTSGSVHYWAIDWGHAYELTVASRAVFDRHLNTCVWAKTAPGMGGFYRSQHELFFVFSHGKEPYRNNVQLGRFGRNRTNVWTYPGATGFGRHTDEGNILEWHPTVKPVALMADIILDASVRGDIVVDLFGGSGTTIIAAEKLARIAYTFELDPLYCDTIIRRWQKWTGEKAVRESDGLTFDVLEALAVEGE